MTRASKNFKVKDGELTAKDMSVMRENMNVKQQHEATHYELRDHSLQHRVHMYRDLNDEANRDMIFRLTVDDYEVLLDAEQVMRAVRWV